MYVYNILHIFYICIFCIFCIFCILYIYIFCIFIYFYISGIFCIFCPIYIYICIYILNLVLHNVVFRQLALHQEAPTASAMARRRRWRKTAQFLNREPAYHQTCAATCLHDDACLACLAALLSRALASESKGPSDWPAKGCKPDSHINKSIINKSINICI